jgi:transcriptional regulator with XRE-family HTH domain
MDLKDWVKAARKSAGLTQEQLGEKLGRTKANVGHWETGKHEPSFDQMRRISEVTGHPMPGATPALEPLQVYAVRNVRPVFVCGTCQGGLPETIHEGWLVETAQEYAEVASTDPKAFLCEVVGDSMVPRYMPREYALVEPSTDPEIEDDVLVRLADGSTMLKRLLGRRSGWRFGSYNSAEVLSFREEEVTWVAYVAHPVPARKIKQRSDLMPKAYAGPERRSEAREVPIERRASATYFDTEGKDYPRDPETAARLRKLAG